MNTLMNRIARWRAAAAMLGAIVLPAAMLAVGSAAAAEERPGLEASRGFIEKLADDAIRTWGTGYPSETERLAAMESLIRANFDLGFIVRGVLGRAGRKLDPAEREAFGALFYEFFREVYLPNLSRFHRDDLRVIGARPRGKRDVAVRSEVRGFSGEWVEVDWRVRVTGEGLRVIDIVVAGVSLLLVQRQEIEAVIGRSGFEGLMRALRTLITEAMGIRRG